MSIELNALATLHQPVYRNIISMPHGFDEFDDISPNKQARAYAHRITTKSHVQYNAIDYIFDQYTWNPTRFSDGSYPVWTGSVELMTSFYETIFHWYAKFIIAPDEFQQQANNWNVYRKIFTVHCNAPLIDLRQQAEKNKSLITINKIHYSETQKIGKTIYQAGYPGLLTASARDPKGENAVIFQKKCLLHPAYYGDFRYHYDSETQHVFVTDITSNTELLRLSMRL